MALEFQTFKNTLATKNFKVVSPLKLTDTEQQIAYFYPVVGERYLCIEDFELEDFVDFTTIFAGDVLVLERKSPKCLYYRIEN